MSDSASSVTTISCRHRGGGGVLCDSRRRSSTGFFMTRHNKVSSSSSIRGAVAGVVLFLPSFLVTNFMCIMILQQLSSSSTASTSWRSSRSNMMMMVNALPVLLDLDVIGIDDMPLTLIGDYSTSANGLPAIYDRGSGCFDIRATSLLGLNFTGSSVLFNITEPSSDGLFYYYVSRGKLVSSQGTLNNGTITSVNLPQWTVTDNCGYTTDGLYVVHQASLCDNFCYVDVGPNEIEFIVQSNGWGIVDFVLMNAETNQPVNRGFRCSTIPCRVSSTTMLAIDVVTYGKIGSVYIEVDGPSGFVNTTQIENNKPYASFGNGFGGDYGGRIFPSGQYIIRAIAYSEKNRGGISGPVIQYTFIVT